MIDAQCVEFLQWALPRLRMRWPGFRKVRKQVCKRLDRRIQELSLRDIAGYRGLLAANPDEWTVLDGLCRISISRFYRDQSVFNCLRDEVLPELATRVRQRNDRELRCWSAGCASGEEVYTLAAIWKLRVASRQLAVSLRITATDSDPTLLDRARQGCYGASSLKDFPPEWLPAAFNPSSDVYCIKPEFRECIEFELQDIRYTMPAGNFDLVLCRHVVFTYFDETLQREMLQQILGKLPAGGVLVTGKQEPLPSGCVELDEFRPRMGIYYKRPDGSSN
jgi:chemotaxis protein methyltransferase CheR